MLIDASRIDGIAKRINEGDKSVILFVFKSKELFHVNYKINAGIELCAREDVYVGKEPVIIPTGVKWVAHPYSGFFAQVLPRSSFGRYTPLRMANSVGTIEASYRNEIGVIFQSIGWWKNKKEAYKKLIINEDGTVFIPKGTRIAQLVVSVNIAAAKKIPQHIDVFYVIDSDLFDNVEKVFPTERKGGYGSTGM